jgi:hypothetical protein
MARVGEKRNVRGAFAAKLEERDRLEDLDINGDNIKTTIKIEWERVEWNNLAQNRGMWLAFVNKVVKLVVP